LEGSNYLDACYTPNLEKVKNRLFF
jgi:hypothetical protein